MGANWPITFHHMEPFQESGGSYGNSAEKSLGRPDLTQWELFTRESLQNSWDARDQSSHEDGVSFAVDFRVFGQSEIEVLRNGVFGCDYRNVDGLEQSLSGDSLEILSISDSGTHGLRGPTRASTAVEGASDFVSFIRNIGRSENKQLQGGTYGFGKGVFFQVGIAKTILVYTRTTDERQRRSHRFIAMSSAASFEYGNLNYTGRHWWGERQQGATGNEYAEPYTGNDADRLANALGMDAHFTEERPTGTTILILGPKWVENPEKDLQAIANSLTKWAWPHMVHESEKMDTISFSVTNRGMSVALPEPTMDPALSVFVKCFLDAISLDGDAEERWETRANFSRRTTIRSERPKRLLGRLAVRNIKGTPTDENSAGELLDRHVALIRSPHMVVQYWRGPQDPAGTPYSGVFIADDACDEMFAKSEPPAHDEWNYKTLDLTDPIFGGAKTNPVKIAFDHLQRRLKEYFEPELSVGQSESSTRVTAVARNLGAMISAAGGTDSTIRVNNVSARGKVSSHRRSGVNFKFSVANLIPTNGELVAIFSIKTTTAATDLPVRFTVHPVVVTDGRVTQDPEDHMAVPELLGQATSKWEVPSREEQRLSFDDSDGLELEINEPDWEAFVAITQPEDTVVTLKISELRLKATSVGSPAEGES